MKINFTYDEQKYIECLLSKGAGSINQPNNKTKTYEALLAYTSDIRDEKTVRKFVQNYIHDNKIKLSDNSVLMQAEWDKMCNGFEKCAELKIE